MNRFRLTTRLSLAGTLALLATGVLLPSTALAGRADPQHTRYRYFQDTTLGSTSGKITLAVLYRQNAKGIFTPREMVGYHLQTAVSCNPGGPATLEAMGNAFSKYGYFAATLVNGHWSHRFENQSESPQVAPLKGSLGGTVLARKKKAGRVIRTARIDGSLTVEDWDPFGLSGVQENCTGSASYSAQTCKRRMSPRAPAYDKWKRWQVPVCRLRPF